VFENDVSAATRQRLETERPPFSLFPLVPKSLCPMIRRLDQLWTYRTGAFNDHEKSWHLWHLEYLAITATPFPILTEQR
jgi:hypothetical protein